MPVYDQRVSRRDDLALVTAAAGEAVTLDELGARVLPPLQRVAKASAALLYRYDEHSRLAPICGSISELIEHYGRHYLHHDPVHTVPRRLAPEPRVVLATRQVDRATYRKSAAYGEFYREYELDHLACVWLTHHPYATPGMTGLLLARGPRAADFDRDDQRVLGTVLAALTAAAARAERLHHLDREREVLEALVADRGTARLVLSATGAVIWSSRDCARLIATVPDALRGAARRHADRANGKPGIVAPPTIALAGGLTAHLSIVRAASGEPFVLVELAGGPRRPDELARRHGLTPAEASVLGELANGLSNAAIAAQLGSSIETVRTHVRRVLAKLGVTSRVQAALLASRHLSPNA